MAFSQRDGLANRVWTYSAASVGGSFLPWLEQRGTGACPPQCPSGGRTGGGGRGLGCLVRWCQWKSFVARGEALTRGISFKLPRCQGSSFLEKRTRTCGCSAFWQKRLLELFGRWQSDASFPANHFEVRNSKANEKVCLTWCSGEGDPYKILAGLIQMVLPCLVGAIVRFKGCISLSSSFFKFEWTGGVGPFLPVPQQPI